MHKLAGKLLHTCKDVQAINGKDLGTESGVMLAIFSIICTHSFLVMGL